MSQVRKFTTGGNVPLNKDKYILKINGVDYDADDIVSVLQQNIEDFDNNYTGQQPSNRDIRRGKVSENWKRDEYYKLLDAFKNKSIKEINAAPDRFDINYTSSLPTHKPLDSSNQYSSSYGYSLINSLIPKLKQYKAPETPKTKIGYSFEDIMKDQVGDYLNTFYHNASTPEQRLGMVMNAYKGYRQKYYDPYWNATDKSGYEGELKFNGKDFDNLIDRLSSGQELTKDEVYELNRSFNDLPNIYRYIYGDPKQIETSGGTGNNGGGDGNSGNEGNPENPEIPNKEGAKVKSYNGWVIDDDGVITKDGEAFTGHIYDVSPKRPEWLPNGWYVQGGYKNKDNDNNSYTYDDIVALQNYHPILKEILQNYAPNKFKYTIPSSSKGISSDPVMRMREYFPNLFPDDNAGYTINYHTPNIDTLQGQDNNFELFSIVQNNAKDRIANFWLKPNAYVMVRKDSQGNPIERLVGDLEYDPKTGFQILVTRDGKRIPVGAGKFKQGKDSTSIDNNEFSKLFLNMFPWQRNSAPTAGNNYNLSSTGNVMNIFSLLDYKKEGGKFPLPRKHQEGGTLSIKNYQTKKEATTSDLKESAKNFTWDNLSTADKADLVALASDVVGLGSTAALGVGNVVGAGAGLASTVSQLVADISRDGFDWGDVGNAALGLTMDAGTIIPALGTYAKTFKTIKGLKRVGGILQKAFVAAGAAEGLSALQKAMSDEEMTINDWKSLARGLTAVVGGARMKLGKSKFTDVATENSISVNGKKISLTDTEAKAFNKLKSKDAQVEWLKNNNKITKQTTPVTNADGTITNKETFKIGDTEIDPTKISFDDTKIRLGGDKWYKPLSTRATAVTTKGNRYMKRGINERDLNWFERSLHREQQRFYNYAPRVPRQRSQEKISDITNRWKARRLNNLRKKSEEAERLIEESKITSLPYYSDFTEEARQRYININRIRRARKLEQMKKEGKRTQQEIDKENRLKRKAKSDEHQLNKLIADEERSKKSNILNILYGIASGNRDTYLTTKAYNQWLKDGNKGTMEDYIAHLKEYNKYLQIHKDISKDWQNKYGIKFSEYNRAVKNSKGKHLDNVSSILDDMLGIPTRDLEPGIRTRHAIEKAAKKRLQREVIDHSNEVRQNAASARLKKEISDYSKFKKTLDSIQASAPSKSKRKHAYNSYKKVSKKTKKHALGGLLKFQQGSNISNNILDIALDKATNINNIQYKKQ